MKLSEFYDYVFGSRAIIQPNKRLRTEEQRKAFIEKKQDEIRQAFAFLTDPDKNNPLRPSFLVLLSSLHTPSAEALKSILYGSEQAERSQHDYDDEAIKEKFRNLNQQFKYFSGETAPQAENDFVEFYKACKLTGDYVECNNDADNTLALDLAYKMLVVLGAAHGKNQSLFANVEAYLKQHSKQEGKPVHDALVQSIPVNEPPLQDLAGWRKFISKYGYKALEYFQEAPAIESKLSGKAPQTKEEAEKAAAQLTYPRASEYPPLARLCKQYHLSEDVFNKCLEVEKKRKQKDVLPDVLVDGKEVGHEGYYLVKLPVDDPHAYILGKITMCCQSMGGHGEQCVIDGLTREKNGFYVLLKEKRKSNALPIENNQINYQAFDIVGQGYAWLSKKENLVFDSWENLRPESDDKVIVPLLKKFAEKATEQKAEMLRVTIGRGGKTPGEFRKEASLGERSEKIMEGHQYGDSREQSLIYVNQAKLDVVKSALLKKQEELILAHWQTREAFTGWLDAFPISSYHDLRAIEALFLNQEIAALWKKEELFEWVTSQSLKRPSILDAVHLLYRQQLLTEDNLKTIKLEATKELLVCLLESPLDLISDENFKLLAAHAAHAGGIGDALSQLYKANPALVNDENFKLLAAHAENAEGIGFALWYWYEANPALVNDESLKLLAAHAANAKDIGCALWQLNRVDPALVNNENFKLLAAHAVDAEEIGFALVEIYRECVQAVENTSNTQNGLNQQGLFSQKSLALPASLAEKIKQYLCGDRAISFNHQEKEELERWGWESKIKNYIPLASLPDEVPQTSPTQPHRGSK